MRSMAVRPSSFSRLRCWAGVSSLSNTTVSQSVVERDLVQLVRLALARRRWADRARARRCTTRPTSSAPAVSTSCDSSSRPASVSSVVRGGRVTPTRTIFSRKERSISDMGVAPVTATACRWTATEVASPVSSTGSPRVTSTGPPGMWTVACVAGQLPLLAGGRDGARAGAAGQRGADAALVDDHRRARRAAAPGRTISTLAPPGVSPSIRDADRHQLVRGRAATALAPVQDDVRVADVDPGGPEHVARRPTRARRRRPWPGPCRR